MRRSALTSGELTCGACGPPRPPCCAAAVAALRTRAATNAYRWRFIENSRVGYYDRSRWPYWSTGSHPRPRRGTALIAAFASSSFFYLYVRIRRRQCENRRPRQTAALSCHSAVVWTERRGSPRGVCQCAVARAAAARPRWNGTLVTTTFGLNSSAPLMSSACWLWSRCCQRRCGTNSGRMTVT
jgi:hypothetical protein